MREPGAARFLGAWLCGGLRVARQTSDTGHGPSAHDRCGWWVSAVESGPRRPHHTRLFFGQVAGASHRGEDDRLPGFDALQPFDWVVERWAWGSPASRVLSASVSASTGFPKYTRAALPIP